VVRLLSAFCCLLSICMLSDVCCLFPVLSCCLLPTVYYLNVCCLLCVVCCLQPAAWCLSISKSLLFSEHYQPLFSEQVSMTMTWWSLCARWGIVWAHCRTSWHLPAESK
jgi:hypothetical protein